MDVWASLVRALLLGSDRVQVNLQSDGAIGRVLARLGGEREQVVLGAVAALALHRRAGVVAAAVERPAVVVSEPEIQPRIEERAALHLERLLADERSRRLLPEWLAAVREAGRRVQETALPDLLEVGRHDRTLRPLITAVIGARGRWLAAQNNTWAFAIGAERANEEGWDRGTTIDRLAIVDQLRRIDPARARARVEEVFPTERARERAAFVEALAPNLSLEDEPFLERVLDDRSKEVRLAAAQLLMTLEGSRLVERMKARARVLITVSNGLAVQPPWRIDEAMLRDGVDEEPGVPIGKRAYWLQQIIAAVPPGEFASNKTITPLIKTTKKHDFAGPVLLGLAQAAVRFKDSAWCEALIAAGIDQPSALVGLVPRARREALFLPRIQPPNSLDDQQRALALLVEVGEPWGPELSLAAARALREAVLAAVREMVFEVRDLLLEASRLMDWRIAEELVTIFSGSLPDLPVMVRSVDHAAHMLQFRRQMHLAISGGP